MKYVVMVLVILGIDSLHASSDKPWQEVEEKDMARMQCQILEMQDYIQKLLQTNMAAEMCLQQLSAQLYQMNESYQILYNEHQSLTIYSRELFKKVGLLNIELHQAHKDHVNLMKELKELRKKQ